MNTGDGSGNGIHPQNEHGRGGPGTGTGTVPPPQGEQVTPSLGLSLPPLPPPPPPSLSSSSTSTSMKVSAAAAAPTSASRTASTFGPPSTHPHESTLGNMPSLESAPPSANLNFNYNYDKDNNVHQPTNIQKSVTGSSGSNSNSPILPPPPPPPKVRTRALSPTPPPPPLANTSMNTSTNMNMHMNSNALPLPPPPTVAPTVVRPTSLPAAPASSPSPAPSPVPPSCPPRLPLTTFLPNLGHSSSTTTTTTTTTNIASANPSVVLLARRQTHLPLLIIATEGAQHLAWKNGLQLVDMFQGILETVDITNNTSTSTMNNSQNKNHFTNSKNSNVNNKNIPTFRSISKHISLKDGIHVQCISPEQLTPSTYEGAHSLLSSHAKLQSADGNLAQELTLLEDRVELLVPDLPNTNNNNTNNNNINNNMNYNATTSNSGGGGGGGGNDTALGQQDPINGLAATAEAAYQLTSPLDIPWLMRFRYALDASTDALPHDLCQCPALILYVCATQESEPSVDATSTSTTSVSTSPSPIQILQELIQPHFLPDAWKDGRIDPKLVRQEVLVLHDHVEGPTSLDERTLRQQLHQQFGPHAAMVRINSVPSDVAQALAAEETTDIWGGKGQLGNRLSYNDRTLLARYFQTLILKSFLPAIEHRIAQLNAIVSERKKGVRNLVKSFWRKSKDDSHHHQQHEDSRRGTTGSGQHQGYSDNPNSKSTTTASSSTVKVDYRFDTIESQTRLLADTLFQMKDYEEALSTYRLVRDDFKSDKAMVYYASIHEMMGLCLYHMDAYGRAREIFSHWESALLSYTRAAEEEREQMTQKPSSGRPTSAPHATRLATRLCLLLATAATIGRGSSLTQGREVEVADLLASASSHESSLGAAVLLEQASSFYFEAGMFRKYAFHMLMSGHMFRTAQQDHHAFRCFTSALYIYRQTKWTELHGHLQSALAAQLYAMERMTVALILYAAMCRGTTKVSTKSQQKFLSHLLEICRDYPKQALAGADRMAMSPKLQSTRERDLCRQAYLDRIVQVIQTTPGASRVLELPYMQLPRIIDSSVRIWTHAEEHCFFTDQNRQSSLHSQVNDGSATTGAAPLSFFSSSFSTLGEKGRGDDSVWNELELHSVAEYNAVDKSTARGLDENTTTALSKIQNPLHRRVIAQIDKEKQSRALLERNRKKGRIREKPKERPHGEPIMCEFLLENPLGIDIRLTEIQLVAQMVDNSDTICTNQDAILLDKDHATNMKDWNFSCTEEVKFYAPDFVRLQTRTSQSSTSAKENPFFVVTKQNLELMANEAQTVSASITPLKEGDLEILGVRCKLDDEVWIYHPFELLGPLLNDTRSNRANRVRGESLMLKSKIMPAMPCVTAELVRPLSTSSNARTNRHPVLEGEISDWMIRLKNIGSAPADDIMLKTNLPWVKILKDFKTMEKLSTQDVEGMATSHCIGPTGTLMSLPLQDQSLQRKGILEPNESVDIPIQVRCSKSGKKELYMLYRYSKFDDAADSTSTQRENRWLRNMYRVSVFPTLSISAKVVTSQWDDNEHVLSVDFSNQRTDHPTDLNLKLDKVALVSRMYQLQLIPDQMHEVNSLENLSQLGWQQERSFQYRVIPSKEGETNCRLSEFAFQEDFLTSSVDCSKSDTTEFLCLERANETFKAAWKNHQKVLFQAANDQDGSGDHPRSIASIRRSNTTDILIGTDSSEQRVHPTSIGALCPVEQSRSSVHLLCHWRAVLEDGADDADVVIHGEHHLRSLTVRSSSGLPLQVTAKYPSSISHDFTSSGCPALLPIALSFRNQGIDGPLSFRVKVRSDDPNSFEWLGLGTLPVSELQPDEKVEVSLEVLIPQAGTYDLQSLEIEHILVDDNDKDDEGAVVDVVIDDEKKEETKADESIVVYHLQQQWLLRVIDSA